MTHSNLLTRRDTQRDCFWYKIIIFSQTLKRVAGAAATLAVASSGAPPAFAATKKAVAVAETTKTTLSTTKKLIGLGAGVVAVGAAAIAFFGEDDDEDEILNKKLQSLEQVQYNLYSTQRALENQQELLTAQLEALKPKKIPKQDFLEADPYWDQTNVPVNVYKNKAPFTGKYKKSLHTFPSIFQPYNSHIS